MELINNIKFTKRYKDLSGHESESGSLGGNYWNPAWLSATANFMAVPFRLCSKFLTLKSELYPF